MVESQDDKYKSLEELVQQEKKHGGKHYESKGIDRRDDREDRGGFRKRRRSNSGDYNKRSGKKQIIIKMPYYQFLTNILHETFNSFSFSL